MTFSKLACDKSCSRPKMKWMKNLLLLSLLSRARGFVIIHHRGKYFAASRDLIGAPMQKMVASSRISRSTTYLQLLDGDNSSDIAEASASNGEEIEVTTIQQKVKVCLYRFTLTSASVAYATGQLSKILLEESSGLSTQTVSAIDQTSHAIMGWGIVLSALFAPSNNKNLGGSIQDKENNDGYGDDGDDDKLLFSFPRRRVNELLLPTLASFVILVEIINTTIIKFQNKVETSDLLSVLITAGSTTLLDNNTIKDLFICAICWREIIFFGAGYKAEAILAIFFSVLSLALNNYDDGDLLFFSEGILTAGTVLCLLVLSFGKFFEPIEDDLRPNKSAFFRDDR